MILPFRLVVAVTGLLALLSAGCARKIKREELEGPWLVIDAKRAGEKRHGFAKRRKDELVMAGAFFCFYGNGTATTVFNRVFQVGTWEFEPDAHEIVLRLPDRQEWRLRVEAIDSRQKRFSEVSPSADFHFEVERDLFDYGDRDIYSPAMNVWRTGQYTGRSDAELRQRMLNMLRFLEAYFEAAYVKELASVDVTTLPTPFVFAANGIGLAPALRVPSRWNALFARHSDATRAMQILGGTFDDVVVPATKNHFERFSLMLHQMATALERQIAAAELTGDAQPTP